MLQKGVTYLDQPQLANKKLQSRYLSLQKQVLRHRKLVHVDDTNELHDTVLDSLKREITELEKKYPELKTSTSQSQIIVGGIKSGFTRIKHKKRQWSLNDIFTEDELISFMQDVDKWNYETNEKPDYFLEDKIDGLKIILNYEDGVLKSAATRGDGVEGEKVTDNVLAIPDIPQTLRKAISVIVEGEVFITTDEFNRINKEREKQGLDQYANPRNLAAGTIRQLDTLIVKERKLNYIAYDISYAESKIEKNINSQHNELILLEQLGFKINPHHKVCKNSGEISLFWKERLKQKAKLAYWIDGVVIKVNDISLQKKMGFTGKAPRFACAFKFPAEQTTSVIENIAFQVGRTGVITPVAHLTPTLVAGSLVSRATLHNEDYIKKLDICIGDTVVIRKAGDIIPEVVKNIIELRPENSKKFSWPTKILECGGDGSIYRPDGKSAWYCKSVDSFMIRVRKFTHFANKNAFDIDGLGTKTVEQFVQNNILNQYSDIFTLQFGDIDGLPGWQEKSIKNLLQAIQARKRIRLSKLLFALSIRNLGEESAMVLSRRFKTLEKIFEAPQSHFTEIDRIDTILAGSIIEWYENEKNKIQLKQLLKHITVLEDAPPQFDHELGGKRLVITGSFPLWERRQIKERLRGLGAEIGSAVSKNTDYVVAGLSPGTKLNKAQELGIEIISEGRLKKWMEN